ncbi:unnamed protein product [Cuscuta campestris]|uniref:HAT C-terminal dimerisation domain-containing protein n=1 Tax=Cuscuta campestris TaxID=132261 RepID=A0A484KWX7_9ASTE|nr:unnamed protein product [Cuscuta campestris]
MHPIVGRPNLDHTTARMRLWTGTQFPFLPTEPLMGVPKPWNKKLLNAMVERQDCCTRNNCTRTLEIMKQKNLRPIDKNRGSDHSCAGAILRTKEGTFIEQKQPIRRGEMREKMANWEWLVSNGLKALSNRGLDNLDRDDEPTLQSNDVDVETGVPETSRGPDKGVSGGYGGPEKHIGSRHPVEYAKYMVKKKGRQEVQTQISRFANREISRVIRYYTRRNSTTSAPEIKKGFSGIVGGLLAKKGKRAQSSTSSSGTTVSSHNELAIYHGVPCDYDDDDVNFDVLGWWKQNEHMFPCLGMLARQVLSVPVSTVAVEREFSAGGNILTDFRSCLSAESLETLVCNQDWLLARRRAQESSYQLESEHYMNATNGSPSSEE